MKKISSRGIELRNASREQKVQDHFSNNLSGYTNNSFMLADSILEFRFYFADPHNDEKLKDLIKSSYYIETLRLLEHCSLFCMNWPKMHSRG